MGCELLGVPDKTGSRWDLFHNNNHTLHARHNLLRHVMEDYMFGNTVLLY